MSATRRSFLRSAAIVSFGTLTAGLLGACRPSAPASKPAAGNDGAATKAPSTARRTAATAAVNTHTTTGTGSGGVLRIGMSATNVPIPDTPPTEGGEGRRFVGTQIYEGLTRFNSEQAEKFCTPVPGMAESWTVSDDKMSWTFKLRPNQKFHDGTPFNAEAVKFNFDRWLDKNAPHFNQTISTANIQYTSAIEKYEVVDPMTFKIFTKRPYAFLNWDLCYLFFASPAAVTKYGKEYVQHASGTGPFRMTKYVDGQVMELEPNEGYWQGKPKLDKLVLLPMPEPASRLAGLQSGTVDWAEVPPPNAVAQLKDQGFQVITGPYPHIITYQYNMYKAPFDDVRVRQAINYAVNRDATIAVIDGFGTAASQYCHKGHPWFDDSWEGYSYDPTKAKELLTAAGYANGMKLKMAYPPGGSGNMWPGPMNERLKADLSQIGVDVELVPLEWNNIISGRRAGFKSPDWNGYDLLHISLSLSNPVQVRDFTSLSVPPAGCCNAPGYSKPEIDQAYQEAERTFDEEKQNALLRKVQGSAMKDGYALVTVHDLNLRVLSSKVRNFIQPQCWTVDLYNVYMEK